MNENNKFYLVCVPINKQLPIKLLCVDNEIFINGMDLSECVAYFYTDRIEAIEKYRKERDKLIHQCLESINAYECVIRDMQNWNPFSIE